MMLFHVSEESGIERFEPRAAPSADAPVVWAIDGDHLRNYLLPRDCPRVTFYAGKSTTATDVEQFLGPSPAVIAVESGWLERLRSCRLYCYHLPGETFECVDECAGYYVSRIAVVPTRVEVIDDPIAAIVAPAVSSCALLPELWTLRDRIVVSSLQFSCIRMRNASPRADSGQLEASIATRDAASA